MAALTSSLRVCVCGREDRTKTQSLGCSSTCGGRSAIRMGLASRDLQNFAIGTIVNGSLLTQRHQDSKKYPPNTAGTIITEMMQIKSNAGLHLALMNLA